MRRGFSIFLILLFGLGPLSATISASEDANLPACCRRHGAHHCAMGQRAAEPMAEMEPGSAPVATAPQTCPDYPGSTAAILMAPHALRAEATHFPVPAAHIFKRASIRVKFSSSANQTHAGRGPPGANLI
jgi:hypothetical protein